MIHFHSIGEILRNPAAVAIVGIIVFRLYPHALRLSQLVIEDAGAGKPASHYHVLVLLQFAAIGSGVLALVRARHSMRPEDLLWQVLVARRARQPVDPGPRRRARRHSAKRGAPPLALSS